MSLSLLILGERWFLGEASYATRFSRSSVLPAAAWLGGSSPADALLRSGAGAALGFGFPGMGFGDVKRMAMIGAFVGPVGVIESLAFGSAAGLVPQDGFEPPFAGSSRIAPEIPGGHVRRRGHVAGLEPAGPDRRAISRADSA